MEIRQISYPDIVNYAIGKKGKKLLEIFLAILRF